MDHPTLLVSLEPGKDIDLKKKRAKKGLRQAVGKEVMAGTRRAVRGSSAGGSMQGMPVAQAVNRLGAKLAKTTRVARYEASPEAARHAIESGKAPTVPSKPKAPEVGKRSRFYLSPIAAKGGAGSHKYVSREGTPGHYTYNYGDSQPLALADHARTKASEHRALAKLSRGPKHMHAKLYHESAAHGHTAVANGCEALHSGNEAEADNHFGEAYKRFQWATHYAKRAGLEGEAREAQELEDAHKQYGPQVVQSKKSLTSRKGTMKKSDNNVDVDMDAGHMGIASYGGGQTSMRVDENAKCDQCLHYDKNVSSCRTGLIPSVCGDGTYPEIGYSPVTPNRIAAKNWTTRHQDQVVTSAQAADQGYEAGEVPFRIEVLGDSALALSERMTLLKSAHRLAKAALSKKKARKILHDKEVHGKPLTEKQRRYFGAVASGSARKSDVADLVKSLVEDFTGEQLLRSRETPVRDGKLSLGEFADAMGSTVDVVRSIAQRLGDRHEFAKFVKSKLPDIRMAHGLTEGDMARLYRSALNTIKSLSSTEWEMWKGVSFEADGVSDAALAQAIQRHGILDSNTVYQGNIIAPREPVPMMPAPEPIQYEERVPLTKTPAFVGGSLSIASDISKMCT